MNKCGWVLIYVCGLVSVIMCLYTSFGILMFSSFLANKANLFFKCRKIDRVCWRWPERRWSFRRWSWPRTSLKELSFLQHSNHRWLFILCETVDFKINYTKVQILFYRFTFLVLMLHSVDLRKKQYSRIS